jgi:hypothetical protein
VAPVVGGSGVVERSRCWAIRVAGCRIGYPYPWTGWK